jgi:GTPase SAR1 family protein
MEHTALLYFVGSAGAGKSTLVATLQEWMQHYRYDGVAVNLDPGAETVAYEAAIDVREKFTLSDIMDQYSLGPNGAQVVCADLLALELDWMKEQIQEVHCDYFLVDTHGIEIIPFDRGYLLESNHNALLEFALSSNLTLVLINQHKQLVLHLDLNYIDP